MRTSVVRVACAALLLSTVAALGASPKNALVIGTTLSNISTLDPAQVNAKTPSEVLVNLYDNLVQVPANDPRKVEPMLATSWTVSDDRTSIAFTLRDGVTFASGNPVTADDVVWSLRRLLKLGGVGASELSAWGFTDSNAQQSISAPDERTVVLKLPEPVSTDLVLYSLASSSTVVLDRKEVERNATGDDLGAKWLKSHAAGSGPYKLTQWRPNDALLADARQDYWQGEPGMRRVVMRHVPESGSLRLQLESGDVDVGQYVSSGDVEALQSKGLVVDPGVGFGFHYIALSAKDPDLAKPLVRQAFQHLMDWKALQQTTMKFAGFPWQSIIPKGMPGAPEGEPAAQAYDPVRAKELLSQAGYPNGLKKTLFPQGAAQVSLAVALQASAKAAGVELDIVPGDHVPEFRARKFQVLIGNTGSRLPDPYGTFLQYAYNPDNGDEAKTAGYYLWRTGLDAPELSKLVTQSKADMEPAKRAELLAKVDQEFRSMNPTLIVLFQRMDPNVIVPAVKGYVGHPTWTIRWLGVHKD